MLGVPLAEVRRLVQLGDVRTSTQFSGGRPKLVIAREDIEEILRQGGKSARAPVGISSGEAYSPMEASRVFAALEEGKRATQIVVELEIHPNAVRAIKERWDELRDMEDRTCTLTPKQLKELWRAGVPLEEDDQPEIVFEKILQGLEEVTCTKCKHRTAKFCTSCAVPKEKKVKEEAVSEEGED